MAYSVARWRLAKHTKRGPGVQFLCCAMTPPGTDAGRATRSIRHRQAGALRDLYRSSEAFVQILCGMITLAAPAGAQLRPASLDRIILHGSMAGTPRL